MSQLAKKLRVLLDKTGMVDGAACDAALAEATAQKRPFTEILVKKGHITEAALLALTARAAHLPPIDLKRLRHNKEVLETVPIDVARSYKVFPIDRIGQILTVAIANPFDVLKLDDIRIITGCQLRPVVSTEEAIEAAIPLAYKSDEESVGDLLDKFDDGDLELKENADDEEGMDLTAISDESSPVVKMVNKIISDAVTNGVSDIHFEPFEKRMVIRYRRDGDMVEVMLPKVIKHMPGQP